MLVLRVQLRCSTSNLQTKNLHGCKRRMTIVNGSPALRLPYAHGGGLLGRDASHRRPGNSNPLTSGAKSCTEPDIRATLTRIILPFNTGIGKMCICGQDAFREGPMVRCLCSHRSRREHHLMLHQHTDTRKWSCTMPMPRQFRIVGAMHLRIAPDKKALRCMLSIRNRHSSRC